MKLTKIILSFILVLGLAFACKSEKKELKEATEEAIEAVEETAEEVAEEAEEVAEEAEEVAEEVAEEAEEVAEEAMEEAKTQKLSVVYPKDTKLANEVEKSIIALFNENPTIEQHFYDAYGFAVFPVITKAGLGIGGAGGKGLVFENKTVRKSSKTF